jgi:hypothetical protein
MATNRWKIPYRATMAFHLSDEENGRRKGAIRISENE